MKWRGVSMLLLQALSAQGGLLQRRYAASSNSFTIKATRIWVSVFVRDLGLCPFAAPVLRADEQGRDRLRIIVSGVIPVRGRMRDDDIIAEVTQECKLILEGPAPPETTLIVYPKLHSFASYLDTLHTVEAGLASSGLDELIQVASFHPKYVFQDEDPANVTNFTNRSPFPMIHLLRVKDVATAIDTYEANTKSGDMDSIWRRNQRTMLALGHDKVRNMNDEVVAAAREADEDDQHTTA